MESQPKGGAITAPANSAASLPPQRRAQREALGVRITGILHRFWVDDDAPEIMQVQEMETWMDVLESVSDDELRHAWAEYQKIGPRTQRGKLTKPDPGYLHNLIEGWRAEAVRAAHRNDPPVALIGKEVEPPATPEQRAAILREVYGSETGPDYVPRRMK